jgi:hypothetical protein
MESGRRRGLPVRPANEDSRRAPRPASPAPTIEPSAPPGGKPMRASTCAIRRPARPPARPHRRATGRDNAPSLRVTPRCKAGFIADLVATVCHALQGRDDPRCSGMVSGHAGRRGLLHAWVNASATAEGWKRGRGPSAFSGDTYPAILVPPRRRWPAASAPEPDLTKPDARSCEAWPREKARRSRRVSREGTVRRIAHRVKPEWWVAGR